MHDLAVGAGWVSGPEFWRMKPGQFWWMYRAKVPKDVIERPAHLSRIRKMVQEAREKEQNG